MKEQMPISQKQRIKVYDEISKVDMILREQTKVGRLTIEELEGLTKLLGVLRDNALYGPRGSTLGGVLEE